MVNAVAPQQGALGVRPWGSFLCRVGSLRGTPASSHAVKDVHVRLMGISKSPTGANESTATGLKSKHISCAGLEVRRRAQLEEIGGEMSPMVKLQRCTLVAPAESNGLRQACGCIAAAPIYVPAPVLAPGVMEQKANSATLSQKQL